MSTKKSAQGIPKVRYDGNINADYVPAIILQVSKITSAGYSNCRQYKKKFAETLLDVKLTSSKRPKREPVKLHFI